MVSTLFGMKTVISTNSPICYFCQLSLSTIYLAVRGSTKNSETLYEWTAKIKKEAAEWEMLAYNSRLYSFSKQKKLSPLQS